MESESPRLPVAGAGSLSMVRLHTNRKGSAWRFLVQQFLEDLGCTVTRRGIGDEGDDLTAVQNGVTFSVEAKNHREMKISAFVDQAERQCPDGQIPVVFAHRRNKATVDDGYVIMSGRAFRRLIS
jgi:hypothetical protein